MSRGRRRHQVRPRGVPPDGIRAAGAPVPTSHKVVRLYNRAALGAVALIVLVGLVMTLVAR